MKSYFISDNADTFVGMKMAGVKGEVLHDREEIIYRVNELRQDKEMGIIIITEKIAMLIPELITEIKLARRGPLLVEIPDRHGSIKGKDSIVRYVKESIGLKL